MGLFYRTSSSRYRDFVLDLPEKLMLGVIDTYNKTMDAMRKGIASIAMKQYQTFNFAQPDLNRYVAQTYYKPLRQIVDEINNNPRAWQSAAANLRALGYKLGVDEAKGTIAAYTTPYKQYLAKKQQYLQMVQKKPEDYTMEDLLIWDRYHYNLAENAYRKTGVVTWSEFKPMSKHIDLEKTINDWVKKGGFTTQGWDTTSEKQIANGVMEILTKSTRGISKSRVMQYVLDMLGLEYDIKGNKIVNIRPGSNLSDVAKYLYNKAFMMKFNDLYAQKRAENPDRTFTQDEIEDIFNQAKDYANKNLIEAAEEKAHAKAEQIGAFTTTNKVTTVKIPKNGGGWGGWNITNDGSGLTTRNVNVDLFANLKEAPKDQSELRQKVQEFKYLYFSTGYKGNWVDQLTSVSNLNRDDLIKLMKTYNDNPYGLLNGLLTYIGRRQASNDLNVKDKARFRNIIDKMRADLNLYRTYQELYTASNSYAMEQVQNDRLYQDKMTRSNTYTNNLLDGYISLFYNGDIPTKNAIYTINGKRYRAIGVNDRMIWEEIHRNGYVKIELPTDKGTKILYGYVNRIKDADTGNVWSFWWEELCK